MKKAQEELIDPHFEDRARLARAMKLHGVDAETAVSLIAGFQMGILFAINHPSEASDWQALFATTMESTPGYAEGGAAMCDQFAQLCHDEGISK